MANYKQQLMEIIDGVREDFGVLGTFAFSGQGNVLDVNERFWRVYEAAKKVRALVDDRIAGTGIQIQDPVGWDELEGFRMILQQAGPPAMMANSGLYANYTMRLNQFFIMAQELD